LPYDMITACEGSVPCDDLGECGKGSCYVGIDIGRRHDLFVLWVLEKQGDVFVERELIAEKGLSFAAQEEFLQTAMMKYRPVRVCIDQTGMGEQFTERAKENYGSYTVEGILFNTATKLDLANNLRRNFEEKSLRIEAGNKILRDDLHSLKRTTTSAGNVRFVADRNENGHADRAWALALALHAGQSEHQPFEYESIEKCEWDDDCVWDDGLAWDE
ncbi:MAG: terminase, partial [Spirochaetota bacterium]